MTQRREEHWSTDDDALDWHDRITKDVIRAITRRRNSLGLSAQDVADETGNLGYEVPRNVIANWESGRRKTITIPELIVVAEALDIAPVELLFSPALGGWIDYLPELSHDRWSALTHFTGEARHSLGMYRLRLYRKHAQIWQELQEEHHDAFQLEFQLFQEEWPPARRRSVMLSSQPSGSGFNLSERNCARSVWKSRTSRRVLAFSTPNFPR
ncbi:helix-turn-helix transcriptional regulator [Kitasatospora aureofaciens]|uniref:helix-turn-helix domain-containing protein n=1 Tax=Kitasatospora aureofaciens TaxID=1894 RepID=UPI0033CE4444